MWHNENHSMIIDFIITLYYHAIKSKKIYCTFFVLLYWKYFIREEDSTLLKYWNVDLHIMFGVILLILYDFRNAHKMCMQINIYYPWVCELKSTGATRIDLWNMLQLSRPNTLYLLLIIIFFITTYYYQ